LLAVSEEGGIRAKEEDNLLLFGSSSHKIDTVAQQSMPRYRTVVFSVNAHDRNWYVFIIVISAAESA
jgi:hypothetical protein